MASDPSDPAMRILSAINERRRKSESADRLPEGIVALHAVHSAKSFGQAREIEGNFLVEDASGVMRRISGVQLAALAELEPELVRSFGR